MTRREKQLDRLAKLLALAGSPNACEADAARRQAERFMRKYGLRREDVASREVGYHEVTMSGRGWDSDWRFRLASTAARAYGAEAVRVWLDAEVKDARGREERAEGSRAGDSRRAEDSAGDSAGDSRAGGSQRPERRSGRRRRADLRSEVRIVGEHADVVRAAKLLRRLFRAVRELREVAARVVERDGSGAACAFLDDGLPRRTREESLCDGISVGAARAFDRLRRRADEAARPAGHPRGEGPGSPAVESREVVRVTEGSGKDHSARVEARFRPQQVSEPKYEGVDPAWQAFGYYLAEEYLDVRPGPEIRVKERA